MFLYPPFFCFFVAKENDTNLIAAIVTNYINRLFDSYFILCLNTFVSCYTRWPKSPTTPNKYKKDFLFKIKTSLFSRTLEHETRTLVL